MFIIFVFFISFFSCVNSHGFAEEQQCCSCVRCRVYSTDSPNHTFKFCSSPSRHRYDCECDYRDADISMNLISVKERVPKNISVGSKMEVIIEVLANQDLTGVKIHNRYGTDIGKYLKSYPRASKESEERLVWDLGEMEEGEVKVLRAFFKVDKKGKFKNCITAEAWPRSCTYTCVGEAVLEVESCGPDEICCGEDAYFTIEVTNSGSVTAKDVILRESIPEGFSHYSGRRVLVYQLGDIAPGETQVVKLCIEAEEKGEAYLHSEVESDQTGEVVDERRIDVMD